MGIKKKIRKFIDKYNYNKENPGLIIENKSILITGTNSGIGLELVKLLSQKNKVYCIFKKDSSNLKKIINENIIPIKCDFNLDTEIEKLNEALSESNIEILINNAGTFGPIDGQNLKNLDFIEFNKTMNSNSLIILKIIQNLIKKKIFSLKQIINISSDMSSISNNTNGNYYIYRITKGVMNLITKNLSIDLKEYKTNVFAIHPGNIKTKINPGGTIEAEVCAKKLINFISKNDNNLNGKFINLSDLKVISW